MKISHEWLTEYIDWIEKDPATIADTLTRCMGEIDETEDRGRYLEECVVGEVLSAEKHPNADKLLLCDVKTDKGTKRVVCGGTNVRTGMHVAFAHIGARVRWHGEDEMVLAPVKIRGEKSEGMICAGEELGIESMFPARPEDGERPIADLSGRGFTVGTPLRDALEMNDVVYHIDNHAITNRPDLFSHIGVARECVAAGLATWKKERRADTPAFGKEPLSPAIRSAEESLVPRYMACTIAIDGIGETPDWMKRRLEATGWRSLNLPIDITNYVAMELGMPLHSFDTDDIKGDVVMRGAKKGETIVTLDGKEHTLPEGSAVMSDDEGIFDLLGIMGGKRSATKETTRHILLHSAIVDPVAIRKTIVATGVRTDAATVYEKGIPPVRCEEGFYRALELFLTLVPGARVTSAQHSWGDNGTAQPILLDTARVSRTVGTDIPEERMEAILSDLGCVIEKGKKKDGAWNVTPPLWRLRDLRAEADGIEEIARIYGYNAIPPHMPSVDITPPARDMRLSRLRDALTRKAFFETVHLAFVSPAELTACGMDPEQAVRIANPLGEELSLMRPSLLPHLLATAAREIGKAENAVRCYEYGRVFRGEEEKDECTLLIAAKKQTGPKDEPVLLLKSALEEGLDAMGYASSVQTSEAHEPFMHPGRTGTILCGGAPIGTLYELHPTVRAACDLPDRTAVATIDLNALLALPPSPALFTPLPQFPAMSYDETLPLTLQTGTLLRKARQSHPLLESVETVDLFEGNGRKTITVRFTYRSAEKTLEEAEVAPIHASVLSALS